MNQKKWFSVLFGCSVLILSVNLIQAEETATTAPPAKTQATPKVKKKKRSAKKKGSSAPAATMQEKTTTSVETATTETQTKKLSPSVSAWLKKMKSRVAGSQAKHNKIVAVAAVRGSETTDAPPLYWKGEKSEGAVPLPELQEFETALDTALKGDQNDAKAKLDSFIAAHPESPLVADAKETLDVLYKDTEQP